MWSVIVEISSRLGGFILEYSLGKSLDHLIQRRKSKRLPFKRYSSIPDIYGADALRILLEEHDLCRKDLVDIFETRVEYSDVLNGRQPLTFNHIQKLSKRFYISPLVFFPKDSYYR